MTKEVAKVNFGQLLAATGEIDLQELQSRKAALEKKRGKLQAELAQVQKELQQVQAELNAPIRNAVKAAKLLGIEVPEEYRTTGSNNGGKSKGKYYLEAPGQVPFQAEISRAMWRLSPGSGGSAGKNGEGVLTVAEFWGLVGLTEEEVKVGAIHTVSLPNGKKVTFQRMEEAVAQLEGLRKEMAALERHRSDLLARQHQQLEVSTQLTTATILLHQLRDRVTDASWETRRRLVEALVAWVRVDTEVVNGKKKAQVTMRYRFDQDGGGGNGGRRNSYTLASGLRDVEQNDRGLWVEGVLAVGLIPVAVS